ncbi:MAG TPA: SprT family zinc-dependent metalloprotease [Chloroflexota bacterium]
MSETGRVQFGNTIINYSVVRTARRRKTVEITLDPRDGVLVAAPRDTPAERVRAVVAKRASWIVLHGQSDFEGSQARRFVSGESVPYLGRQVRLVVTLANVKKASVAFSHWSLAVTAPADLPEPARRAAIERALVRWYRQRAADRLPKRVQYWAPRVGVTPTEVLIRAQSARWASCSPSGVLRFNWRVVMAPPALIDYVVVHELVHLRVRTHTAAFWAELARLIPDFKLRRAHLKEVGPYCTL